ncbi:MAG: hypothetical protein VXY77_03795 [Pseudomonadota bacterium]|nr:hypothetical protein [Pseudomonadota bacterium]
MKAYEKLETCIRHGIFTVFVPIKQRDCKSIPSNTLPLAVVCGNGPKPTWLDSMLGRTESFTIDIRQSDVIKRYKTQYSDDPKKLVRRTLSRMHPDKFDSTIEINSISDHKNFWSAIAVLLKTDELDKSFICPPPASSHTHPAATSAQTIYRAGQTVKGYFSNLENGGNLYSDILRNIAGGLGISLARDTLNNQVYFNLSFPGINRQCDTSRRSSMHAAPRPPHLFGVDIATELNRERSYQSPVGTGTSRCNPPTPRTSPSQTYSRTDIDQSGYASGPQETFYQPSYRLDDTSTTTNPTTPSSYEIPRRYPSEQPREPAEYADYSNQSKPAHPSRKNLSTSTVATTMASVVQRTKKVLTRAYSHLSNLGSRSLVLSHRCMCFVVNGLSTYLFRPFSQLLFKVLFGFWRILTEPARTILKTIPLTKPTGSADCKRCAPTTPSKDPMNHAEFSSPRPSR